MKGIFTTGLIVGAVTTAAILENRNSLGTMFKKSRRIIKRKISDIIDF